MSILHTRMDPPKKRRLIRKKPVDDDYSYGPYSLEEDKYSPADIVRARITQSIEKEKFYSTFCPPVIYDFINDKDVTTPEVVKPVVEAIKSSFGIIPADKLREVQREDKRDYRSDKREYRSDKRDYRSDKREYCDTQREYRSDKREYRDTQRDYRSDKRDYRDTTRDNDYHRSRDREYSRTTRHCDPPNPYNGKPSKAKMDLDSELGKYCRNF
jgi:hypothetical protein